MKLKAQLSGREYAIELKFDHERAFLQIDDRKYEVQIRQPEPESYLLFCGNNVYECRVVTSAKDAALQVDLRNQTYSIAIVDPKRLRGSHESHRHQHGKAEIVAPMPGKIVKVSVDVGVHVEQNHGIVIVEAMKMQNEMKAPRAGRVVAINVAPGDTVNAGDVLAVIED